MDPTRYLTQIESIHSQITVKKYREEQILSPKLGRQLALSPSHYSKLEDDHKPTYLDGPRVPNYLANPLENVSENFTPLQIVMANIDAVFNLTGQDSGYLAPQYIKDFDIVDVTGGSINYFQYRVPTTRFFTSRSNDYLDSRQVNLTTAEDLNDFVHSVAVEGVDLVVDTSEKPLKEMLIRALEMCKVGGNWVCQITKISPELFYIVSMCFETVTLFQPMAENLNFDRFYLVAENFTGTSMDWIQLLSLDKELEVNVPQNVYDYLDDFVKSSNELVELLLNMEIETPIYNTYKCKALWNIF